MNRIKYLLICFMFLWPVVLLADTIVSRERIDFDTNLLKDGKIVYSKEYKDTYYQPTIKVFQEMLLTVKNKKGKSLSEGLSINEGVYDAATVELIGRYQKEYMGMGPKAQTLGQMGKGTYQDIFRELKKQKQPAVVTHYVALVVSGAPLTIPVAAPAPSPAAAPAAVLSISSAPEPSSTVETISDTPVTPKFPPSEPESAPLPVPAVSAPVGSTTEVISDSGFSSLSSTSEAAPSSLAGISGISSAKSEPAVVSELSSVSEVPMPSQQTRSITRKYKVQEGDTLDTVASRFGVTSGQIQKDNNVDTLKAGQYLVIKKTIVVGGSGEEPAPVVTPKANIKKIEKAEAITKPEPAAPAADAKSTKEKSLELVKQIQESVDISSEPAAKDISDQQVYDPKMEKYKSEILSFSTSRNYDEQYNKLVEEELKKKKFKGTLDVLDVEKQISLAVGETKIFKYHKPIKRIAIGNPELADTLVLDNRQILLNSKKQGITTLTFWDDQGSRDVYYIVIGTKSAAIQSRLYILKYVKIRRANIEGVAETDKDTVKAIETVLGSIVRKDDFAIFPNINGILVEGTIEDHRRVTEFMNTIDVHGDQILITSKFAELNADYKESLDNQMNGSFSKAAGSFYGKDGTGGVLTFANGADYSTTFIDKITAIAQAGYGKIIASPRVLVQSGDMARMKVGTKIPILRYTGDGSYLEYIEAGVILSVYPIINADNTITTQIMAEYSELTADMYAGYPGIIERQARTTMTVKDGEAIVIAGMVNKRNVESVYKVPLLGDIPFLGEIFKSKSNSEQNTEVIIALSLHILKNK